VVEEERESISGRVRKREISGRGRKRKISGRGRKRKISGRGRPSGEPRRSQLVKDSVEKKKKTGRN